MRVDPSSLTKIRAELVGLVSGRNKRDTALFAAQILTDVYYEVCDAIEAGVTRTEILAVFEANGVPMPLARFSKAMYYLQGLMPAREIEQPCLALVANVSQALKKVVCSEGKPSKPVRSSQGRGTVPMHEKVRDCAAMIVELCLARETDAGAINREFRARFGPGWTLKVALQFAAGEPFAQWVHAAWPDSGEARAVKLAHLVAKAVKAVPDDQKADLIGVLREAAGQEAQRIDQNSAAKGGRGRKT